MAEQKELAVILMGSLKDEKYADAIGTHLKEYQIDYATELGSAHKTPFHVLNIVRKYQGHDKVVFITIAGRSDALTGFVAWQTRAPVIASPPFDKKLGIAKYLSSMDVPSKTGSMLTIYPDATAAAVASIFALSNSKIAKIIEDIQEEARQEIYQANKKLQKKNEQGKNY